MDISIAVRNFGPVSRGDVRLRPLTIFIGPNNSGKSYVATLLRSVLAAQARVVCDRRLLRGAAMACLGMLRQKCGQDWRKMSITRRESGRILGAVLDEGLAPALKIQVERDFGSGLDGLAGAGKGAASVEISERDPGSGEVRRLAVKLGGKVSARTAFRPGGYLVEARPESPYYAISARDRRGGGGGGGAGPGGNGAHAARQAAPARSAGADPDSVCASCAGDIAEMVAGQLGFRTAPGGVHYIPAARSGILQWHPAAHASGAGTGAPQAAGVAADFASQMLSMGRRSGPLAALAGDMEGELLGGSILLDSRPGGGRPEIAYVSAGGRVPLHRSSSTVPEIAPLSLYLRHVVDRGDLLVVEEPEAHLHPASVIVLAKYIVRLVRGGVNVLLTTHSAFLLEKLAKYTMAGGLEPRQRTADLGYGEDDFLAQDEVSACLFERDGDGGHRTRPVDRDDEYGISQEEFVRVSEELHRETIIINSKMWAGGGA